MSVLTGHGGNLVESMDTQGKEGIEEIIDTVGSEAGGKAVTTTRDKVRKVANGIQENSRTSCAVVSHFSVQTFPSQLPGQNPWCHLNSSFSCLLHPVHQVIPSALSLKDIHDPTTFTISTADHLAMITCYLDYCNSVLVVSRLPLLNPSYPSSLLSSCVRSLLKRGQPEAGDTSCTLPPVFPPRE